MSFAAAPGSGAPYRRRALAGVSRKTRTTGDMAILAAVSGVAPPPPGGGVT